MSKVSIVLFQILEPRKEENAFFYISSKHIYMLYTGRMLGKIILGRKINWGKNSKTFPVCVLCHVQFLDIWFYALLKN